MQYHLKIKPQGGGGVGGSASCALVPLAEGGATVWAASLPQREAEEEAQGEEEDGAQDPQAGEVILQDANSAERQHCCQAMETLDYVPVPPAKKKEPHPDAWRRRLRLIFWASPPCFQKVRPSQAAAADATELSLFSDSIGAKLYTPDACFLSRCEEPQSPTPGAAFLSKVTWSRDCSASLNPTS